MIGNISTIGFIVVMIASVGCMITGLWMLFSRKYKHDPRNPIGANIAMLLMPLGIGCPDHIHMLISNPPKYSVSQIMGYLKGKSSLMIFDRHANLKYKYGNRHFWARGYIVDTVGRNKKAIKAYIQNQLEEDKMSDQISIKEYIDPFTGTKNPKA